MNRFVALMMLAVIFCTTSFGWLVLGGVVLSRTDQQRSSLYGSVGDLWGREMVQAAPVAIWHSQREVSKQRSVRDGEGQLVVENGRTVTETVIEHVATEDAVRLDSTRVDVDLHLDQRRKGLLWFPLYDVRFEGTWTVTPEPDAPGTLELQFVFPDAEGMYDDFHFTVNGVEMADAHPPENGRVSIPAGSGEPVTFTVGYRSRGMGSWSYRPGDGVVQLTDFALGMTTDFEDIDFPQFGMSPTEKARSGEGWQLDWTFRRLVTGNHMGMVMPEPVQPGPLAASMIFSAPISLGLFMVWIFVLGLVKKVEIHPVNHLFLAATFFSFHLLFSYSSDHLPVEAAFALSSATSLALTISYLRLVAGPRFALVEAGLAQLLYLVGFSLAHFWDGFTGLTLTVIGIATLFALGQITGRIRWDEVFAGNPDPTLT